MNYLISYDLNKTGKNYDAVYNAIETASTGLWCRPLESVWIIQSALTSQAIYNKITPFIDSDDGLLVIEVTNNYCGYLRRDVVSFLESLLLSPP